MGGRGDLVPTSYREEICHPLLMGDRLMGDLREGDLLPRPLSLSSRAASFLQNIANLRMTHMYIV